MKGRPSLKEERRDSDDARACLDPDRSLHYVCAIGDPTRCEGLIVVVLFLLWEGKMCRCGAF